jgi:hypothetical protein
MTKAIPYEDENAKTVLSVWLSECERLARNDCSLPPEATLDMIAVLRQYMAHAEAVRCSIEAISKILPT